MLLSNDKDFLQESRNRIVDFASESPEMTEVVGGLVLKELSRYKKYRDFEPLNFKLSDSQFCEKVLRLST